MSTIDTISSSHVPKRAAFGDEKHRTAMQLMIFITDWGLRCAERRRSRQALASLSHDQLLDIGISRADAERESCVPFWR